MDGRFNPYDSPGQQRQQAHALQAALEMEEALYLQRQQQDLQIRQMLLQDQIDQQLMQAPTASLLHQQRMYELQNYASQNPLAALQEEQFLQQQLQHQEQLRRQQLQQELNLSAALTKQQSPGRRDFAQKGLAAESLAAAASQATTSMMHPDEIERKRSQEEISGNRLASRKKVRRERSPSAPNESEASLLLAAATTGKKKPRGKQGKKSEDTKKPRKGTKDVYEDPLVVEPHRGTVEELVAAAESEQQVQDAASAVVVLREAEWSDSEPEDNTPAESIELPGFTSSLPRLPEEPEYDFSRDPKNAAPEAKDVNGDAALSQSEQPLSNKVSAGAKPSAAPKSKSSSATDYPFSVDTWWPSNTTIKRERRLRGEKSDEEDCADEPILANEDSMFRADLPSIRSRLVNNIEPGVLEKLPHCKISKMRAKGQKGGVVKSEPVFCWQVTENTCNDVMLCCSVCSTWRHAFCGGHYKPYTVRGMLNSATPFAPICDRCYQEEELLGEFPKARARIDRQRIEQTRRGLATTAVIRQASFAKHGGTYKWPLGSVSTTHIGGHTRSVHSRHDKAEKQWGDMAIRLGSGLGYRPKERVKVRTRELERLLVSVDDAEGIMDRHNMLLFLQRDTSKYHPVGFERKRSNLFDPEDDSVEGGELENNTEGTLSDSATHSEDTGASIKADELELESKGIDEGNSVSSDDDLKQAGKSTCKGNYKQCARVGCSCKPRFDSIFCSDACGVSALELNLMHSLEYAGDIHPSLLRS